METTSHTHEDRDSQHCQHCGQEFVSDGKDSRICRTCIEMGDAWWIPNPSAAKSTETN